MGVMLKISNGQRPNRPLALTSATFCDRIWSLIEACWHQLDIERPPIAVALAHLCAALRLRDLPNFDISRDGQETGLASQSFSTCGEEELRVPSKHVRQDERGHIDSDADSFDGERKIEDWITSPVLQDDAPSASALGASVASRQPNASASKSIPIHRPIQPQKSAALTAMLTSNTLSRPLNPFAEFYGVHRRNSGSGRDVYICLPQAVDTIHITLWEYATVGQVLGYALWRFWEQGWSPTLSDTHSEFKPDPCLSTIGWLLHPMQPSDDGDSLERRLTEFSPAVLNVLNRRDRMPAHEFDTYAIMPANPQQRILQSSPFFHCPLNVS
jgi:hypothetical protein